ncbi:uncharacterized protein CEXT_422381 [Caerostris extrusa]|uniref:Uncharacterized protein n=1 Tax=Caerostris extrusa TaxID=172846 RepID=A0AAV4U2H5_CAEEX|nr:uncharacterized protein CEXT_422381 [Caerostris extrusa]
MVFIAPRWVVAKPVEIDLTGPDGESGTKGQSGRGYGGKGNDGSPGQPGGIFFGIGEIFENGANLKIISNGAMAVQAVMAETGAMEGMGAMQWRQHLLKFPYRGGGGLFNMPILTAAVIHVHNFGSSYKYKIYGFDGRWGGDGGSGGEGVEVGIRELLRCWNWAILLESHKLLGLDIRGPMAELESEGKVEKNGNHVIAECTYTFQFLWIPASSSWSWKETIHNSDRARPGVNGIAGGKPSIASTTRTALANIDFANLINQYKGYLRENLENRFKKSALVEFLNRMDNDDGVRNVYTTMGLIDEFRGLETSFFKIE